MPYSTAAVCDDYLAGATSHDVALRHGVSRRTVEGVLKRHGIRARGSKGRHPRPINHDTAVEMYVQDGRGVAEVARHFGVADARVRDLLAAKGVLSLRSRRGKVRQRVSPDGYVRLASDRSDPLQAAMVPHGHPILEHRLVLARVLGRPLTKHESVHHLNGDRSDNRVENLELRVRYHGLGQQVICADCGSHNVVPKGGE